MTKKTTAFEYGSVCLVHFTMLAPDNITGGIEKLDFFDNIGFVWVFLLDNITGGMGELDFFDNIGFA